MQVKQYREWAIPDRLANSGAQHTGGDLSKIFLPDRDLKTVVGVVGSH